MFAPILKDLGKTLTIELDQAHALIRTMADVIDHGGPSNWLDFVNPEQRQFFEAVTAPGEL